MTDEETTEERFKKAFELYELDMGEWDADIYLDELEFLYNYRERINQIIFKMKKDISIAIQGEIKK